MAVQFLPIIKAALPYIAQIAASTIPAFTSKPEATRADPVVAKQIEELQAAATQNAQSIHILAEKMQLAIQGLESASEVAKRQARTYRALLLLALGCSLVSLSICIYLLAQ